MTTWKKIKRTAVISLILFIAFLLFLCSIGCSGAAWLVISIPLKLIFYPIMGLISFVLLLLAAPYVAEFVAKHSGK